MRWLALAAAACAAACFSGHDGGGGDAAASCSSDVPATCPSVVPSWSNQVHAIVDARCGQCHTDGGVEAKEHAFDTYAHVYAQRTSILTQLASCKMPPPDAAPLTSDERAAILGWLVCHAPEN